MTRLLASLCPAACFFLPIYLTGQCDTTVYDTGVGETEYSNNENYTVTYCPDNPGEAVTLFFTHFNTEPGFDYLMIYDGDSNQGIYIGTFSGVMAPGPFTASSESGCITLSFFSDNSIVSSGWAIDLTCSTDCGHSFCDTGGPRGIYQNDQAYTTTLCPDEEGSVVTLTFTSFDLESNYDYLYIYDGATTQDASLGIFSGNILPGPFTSSDPSGCLTISFVSDYSIIYGGWIADVSCSEVIHVSERSQEDRFVVYPNPVSGDFQVVWKAANQSAQIEVIDLQGNLVYTSPVNFSGGVCNVSPPSLARGSYLIRITSGGVISSAIVVFG